MFYYWYGFTNVYFFNNDTVLLLIMFNYRHWFITDKHNIKFWQNNIVFHKIIQYKTLQYWSMYYHWFNDTVRATKLLKTVQSFH